MLNRLQFHSLAKYRKPQTRDTRCAPKGTCTRQSAQSTHVTSRLLYFGAGRPQPPQASTHSSPGRPHHPIWCQNVSNVENEA